EVWQSADRGLMARRLYDEQGKLIAGDWRKQDGTQTLYHHGGQPRLQIRRAGSPDGQPGSGASSQSAIRNVDDAWLLSPSANDFHSLVDTGRANVEDRGDFYIISAQSADLAQRAEPGAGSQEPGIIKATLTLSKADLHATELTLVVRPTVGS